MHDVVERFMRYVQVESTSDPHNGEQTPSTSTQFAMADLLAEELKALGCTDVTRTEHAYVTGRFSASAGSEDQEPLLLCSHIDTAPDECGKNIVPKLVHYEGGNLSCGEANGEPLYVTPEDVPELERWVGSDMLVSAGNTLLGADDKAGVAEICSLLARLGEHPELKHPELIIAFVPDEEIGHGAALLDPNDLGVRQGYTVDGESFGEFNYECFSAAQARLHIEGVMIHPGSAYGKMVNALTLAAEFMNKIPAAERPEHTRDYEGFYHFTNLDGTASEATLELIIRDFAAESFEARKAYVKQLAKELQAAHPTATIELEIEEQYRNMGEKFVGHEELIDRARRAHEELGFEMTCVAVRGGTDGAQLTYRGLLCPNLATGGYNAHSITEFIPVNAMLATVDVLEKLVAQFA